MPDITLPVPGSTPGPQWASQLNTTITTVNTFVDSIPLEYLDGLKLKRITQAAYDALPTPRPSNILYIVT